MRRTSHTLLVSLTLAAALFLLPFVLILPFRKEAESEPEEAPAGEQDQAITLRVLNGESVTEMPLGEYLVSVLRGEMPASFEGEALKAQAVAARTYTLYKIRTGGNHGGTADVCTDPACCQAYVDEETARSNWGAEAENYEKKLRSAVQATDGELLLYDGAPILAVFHSSSSSLTRRAGVVWSEDLPYLQSVSSPEQGDRIPNYYARSEFSFADFRQRVLSALPEADLSGDAEHWLGEAVRDGAGNVDTVEVGGVSIRGSRLRSILNLRSACFTWEVQEDKLVFFTTGHGHGVGLSQYGANEMALQGASYREILTHYYTGVTVETAPALWDGRS